MKYALVNEADEVVNVIEIAEGGDYVPPEGLTLVASRDFPPAPSPPPLPEPPQKSKPERVAGMLQQFGLTLADLKAELGK